ncbi:MAG: HAD family hydrolase [Lachnospiraceae bacterium]|nr:HAD family hydrolase [Lachnospiraceae bacterium]
MINKEKKLAIFDFDGTLFNTEEVNYYAYKEAVEPFGGVITKEYFLEKCYGRHYKTFVPEILGGIEHLEEVHEAKKKLYAKYMDKVIINRHLFDVIEGIRDKYNIVMVTTATRKNVFDMLTYFGLEETFDLILSQEDIVNPKPDPEGFLKAMEICEAKPQDTVIYEDSDVGLAAAGATGANVIKVEFIA